MLVAFQTQFHKTKEVVSKKDKAQFQWFRLKFHNRKQSVSQA